MTSRRLAPMILVLAFGLAFGASGCAFFGDGADARDAAGRLARALSAGKVTANTFTTDATAAYTALNKPLAGYPTKVVVDQAVRSGSTSDVRLAWTVDLNGITWKRTTHVAYTKKDGDWVATWKPSVLAKGLEDGDTLQVSTVKPERGRILGAGDQPIVEPRPVIRFGIDKTLLSPADYGSRATALARLVGIAPPPYVKQVEAAGPKAFVEAIVLRREEAERFLGRVPAITGARAISDHRALAPSKDFAAAILGTVGPVTAELVKESEGRLRTGDDAGLSGLQLRYDEQLFGSRGVKVSVLPPKPTAAGEVSAEEPEVLFDHEPVPGKDLRTTLDPALTGSAQRLLAGVGPASALVAIKPSTGEILAAVSGPGSKGYNTATFGQYAPGSTFKVISSLALIRAGVQPAERVNCPATTTVDGKGFKNYSDYPANRLGRITLTQAVANSCNTAFIGERAKVTGTALADAAAALGFGVDHDLGFPAYFGQVKPPASKTEAAADLIGQGKVLASPLAMAAVAASVVKGATVVPALLPDHEVPPVAAPKEQLTGGEASQLQALMKAVVSQGSGSFLRSLEPPAVLAKTGTAEYGTTPPLPTHAWMIGARGDLAVAVFVATGASGSRTAGPILEEFLRAAG